MGGKQTCLVIKSEAQVHLEQDGMALLRIFLGALLVAATSTAAQASDWRAATGASTTPAGRALGFIDAESMQRVGNRVEFFAFLIYEPGRPGFDNAIVHFLAKCTSYSFESTQMSSYRGHRNVGSIRPAERGRAAPNSTEFGLIDTACGGRPLDRTRVLDPYEMVRRNARTIWGR